MRLSGKMLQFVLPFAIIDLQQMVRFLSFRCQRLFRVFYSQSEIPSGGRSVLFLAKPVRTFTNEKDGRWERPIYQCRNRTEKQNIASVYARTYTEVKAKLEERKRTFMQSVGGEAAA